MDNGESLTSPDQFLGVLRAFLSFLSGPSSGLEQDDQARARRLLDALPRFAGPTALLVGPADSDRDVFSVAMLGVLRGPFEEWLAHRNLVMGRIPDTDQLIVVPVDVPPAPPVAWYVMHHHGPGTNRHAHSTVQHHQGDVTNPKANDHSGVVVVATFAQASRWKP